MNYSENNTGKKQDVETSLKYMAGYMKYDMIVKDLASCLEPVVNSLHRIANALEDKRHGNN